jgi:hypothetical protein
MTACRICIIHNVIVLVSIDVYQQRHITQQCTTGRDLVGSNMKRLCVCACVRVYIHKYTGCVKIIEGFRYVRVDYTQ